VWRALGQLKAEAATRPLVDAMMRDVWEDWGWDDLPQALVLIGAPAIEPLASELGQRATDYDEHPTLIQSALEMMGTQHEDLRDRVAAILLEQLQKAETNDPTLNGFMIGTLAEWKIEKALPAIEKAFTGDHVDLFIAGDWDEIQIKYGLKEFDEVEAAAKVEMRREEMMRQMGMDTLDLSDLLPTITASAKKAPKKKKAKRKQAQMQRKQNRKKKKK
jgi:hypothetical protein